MNNKTAPNLIHLILISLLLIAVVGLITFDFVASVNSSEKNYETRVTMITPRGEPIYINGKEYYGGAVEVYEDGKLVSIKIGDEVEELTEPFEMPLSEMTEQQKRLLKPEVLKELIEKQS